MKVYLSRFLLAFIMTLQVSCKSDEMKMSCEELSQGCYRGFPRQCHALEKKCVDVEIKYTKEVCQEAFNKLILSANLKLVKNLYGNEVIGCFNKSEIKKYQ